MIKYSTESFLFKQYVYIYIFNIHKFYTHAYALCNTVQIRNQIKNTLKG